jgi:NIMA-interacting peptidyl-prolyl cis-trans isomerase 1
MSVLQLLEEAPPPDPLPPGWILRKSRSQPGTFFYYNQETGEAQWEEPKEVFIEQVFVQEVVETTTSSTPEEQEQQETTTTTTTTSPESIKRPAPQEVMETTTFGTNKRPKTATAAATTSSSSSSPKQVRVLHILKKHKDSRRPASWRHSSNITISKEDARHELEELKSILKESQTLEELRATMEELARTESDCSSAKRGGDVGFFGRKKMQPLFEDASFALDIGELSDIVETSSGVHIILRIG